VQIQGLSGDFATIRAVMIDELKQKSNTREAALRYGRVAGNHGVEAGSSKLRWLVLGLIAAALLCAAAFIGISLKNSESPVDNLFDAVDNKKELLQQAYADRAQDAIRADMKAAAQEYEDIIKANKDKMSYEWQFNEAEDLQNPELPTGCEATALSILLRMSGLDIGKIDVVEAMPRSGSDYVHHYMGNPYSTSGFLCLPPCSVETANELLPDGWEAYSQEGTDLDELELPAAAWVTMYLRDFYQLRDGEDGYQVCSNTHCLVITKVGKSKVEVVDPLVGVTSYDREQFEYIYSTYGKMAVGIKEKLDEATQTQITAALAA